MLTSTQAARLRALAAAKVTATAKPKGLLGKLTSALRPPVPKPGLRLGQRGLAPGLIKPRAIVQTAPGPVSSLAPATPPPPPEAATSSGGGGGGGGGGSWSPDPSSAPEFPPEEAPMEEPPAEEKPGGESVVDKVKSLPKWALYAGGAAVVYYLFFRRS